MKRIIDLIFYGNLFYGLCAVLLCIETSLVFNDQLNHPLFYVIIFACTWIYYTMIYVRSASTKFVSERTLWYRKHLPVLRTIIKVVLAAIACMACYYYFNTEENFSTIDLQHWFLLVVFPLAGLLYTFKFPFVALRKFRQVGWLKPFIVGFTWAGIVTVYPYYFTAMHAGNAVLANHFLHLHFLTNFLFITVLALLFDIKDYRHDKQVNLNTIPAAIGIKPTQFYVALPIILITLAFSTILFDALNFNVFQMTLNYLPIAILSGIIITFKTPKSLLYYLAIIDGLMMFKALCGIISQLIT